ncbi:hypothetical protein B296_00044910 [Ensete ventricosum]|uniref:Uncharacterized protein n=1 Tax=Ensete ventricosum TaxID=4639 RepID=A0A426X9N5_ENSVE|nr:hypothetical protein B296_00044910 [Ensete ventricosum]
MRLGRSWSGRLRAQPCRHATYSQATTRQRPGALVEVMLVGTTPTGKPASKWVTYVGDAYGHNACGRAAYGLVVPAHTDNSTSVTAHGQRWSPMARSIIDAQGWWRWPAGRGLDG